MKSGFTSMAEIADKIAEAYGSEASETALNVAGKYAESEGHGMEILNFALMTAKQVPELQGEDLPALYSCPDCLDKGFIIESGIELRSKRGAERIKGCQRCEPGLSFEAAGWLDQVHPPAADGRNRAMNDSAGWVRFHAYFKRDPLRKQAVMNRMAKLTEDWK